MILIADGGTTKCDWIGYSFDGKERLFKLYTKGMNPAYMSKEDVTKILVGSDDLVSIVSDVKEIYFFGSGCGEGLFEEKLKSVFSSFFKNASRIIVSGDIQGAVYACTDKPGVVGILGTGSNICYFDGNKIEFRIPSLGYTIMDQGSGNAIGRKLLQDYFFKIMPERLGSAFEESYELNIDHIKTRLYDMPGPSSYLASLAKFAFEHQDSVYMDNLLLNTLQEYFDTSVNVYSDYLRNDPIHFVGSIAYHAKRYLEDICADKGIQLGNIVQKPIDRLSERIDWFRTIF